MRVVAWIDDAGNECRKVANSLNEALRLWKQIRSEGIRNVIVKHETCVKEG
jgi:hypothetical protein